MSLGGSLDTFDNTFGRNAEFINEILAFADKCDAGMRHEYLLGLLVLAHGYGVRDGMEKARETILGR